MANEAPSTRADLREALIAAATRTIEKEGWQAVKARALAADVGCAVGSIYNVFPDIDALILDVKARMLDVFEAEVQRQLGAFENRGPDAAADRFLDLGRVYLDFAARNWKVWLGMFEHRAATSPSMVAYMLRLDVILVNIEAPLDALLPGLQPLARRYLARTLFAAVHGVVSLGLDQKLGDLPLADLHAQVRGLIQAALRGYREGGAPTVQEVAL